MALLAVAAVLLRANGLGILEKPGGLLSNPNNGTISDLIRLFCFLGIGVLVHQFEKTQWSVALWVLVFALIDKAFVTSRVALIAPESSGVTVWKLLLGVAAIYVVTVPLLFLIAISGYHAARCFFARINDKSAPIGTSQASAYLACALVTLVLPFVYGLNTYALLWIGDFPIFYLSLSRGAVAVLFYLFISGAAVALLFCLIASVRDLRASPWLQILFGTVILFTAIMIHWKTAII